jgi:hypothetical protein
MASGEQVEVPDRRSNLDCESITFHRRGLLQIRFHVHANYFTKKIKQIQANIYLFGRLSE